MYIGLDIVCFLFFYFSFHSLVFLSFAHQIFAHQLFLWNTWKVVLSPSGLSFDAYYYTNCLCSLQIPVLSGKKFKSKNLFYCPSCYYDCIIWVLEFWKLRSWVFSICVTWCKSPRLKQFCISDKIIPEVIVLRHHLYL